MSVFIDHARRELELIDEEPETIEGYLKAVQAFLDMGHSGGSASVVIPVIHELLQLKPLAPLTYEPDEWIRHEGYGIDGGDLWQNIRDSRIFSYDGGKTYYNVEDV